MGRATVAGADRDATERRTSRRDTVILVGVALTARLVYLFGLGDADAVRSDAAHYNEIALNVAVGRGLSSTFPQLEAHATAFRPPVFPIVLGGLYRITGPSIVRGKLLNVLIGLGVVLLAAHVARRISTARAGLVAGLFVACYPPLVANDVNLLSEPLGLLLVLAVVIRLGRRHWITGAILVGLLVLTRSSAQALPLVLAAWLVWRVGWWRALGFVAIVAATVTPWLVRNQQQVHALTMFTSNGFNLAAIYSVPAQQQHSFVDPVQDPRFASSRVAQFDEGVWNDEMWRLGADGLTSHPGYVAENVVRNTAATFELWPPYNEGPELEDGRNLLVRKLALPVGYVLFVVGAAGLWRARRRAELQLLALTSAYFVAVNVLFLAPPRLRAPLDLTLCIGAGVFVAEAVLPRWRARRVDEPAPEPAPATP